MTVVRVLDDSACERWDAFVAAHPDASFFHRAGWQRVIATTLGQRTHYLYAERNGVLCGVLPLAHVRSRLFGNRLISTACCIGGGPVAEDDVTHQALDAAALSLLKRLGADSLEYRQPSRLHPDRFHREGLYATFERPIERDETACLKQIPRKQRAVVRKALEAGLAAEEDHHVGRFYPLFARSMHALGTPVFARAYVAALMDTFGTACEILTATCRGRPVGSVLSFIFRGRVMPYYVGTAADSRELGSSDFLYWRLMRRASERGCTVFDFGRSKVDTGPYHFKKNWGFEPRPVVHEFLTRNGAPPPEVNPLNPRYRLFIEGWKRLPLPLANLLGPFIVRQVG